MSRSAKGSEAAMLLDYALGGIVAVMILAYLVYALLRPEKF
jgi:K+-transporting ATPase KdpF subunit